MNTFFSPLNQIVVERRIWSHLGWRDLKSRYVRTIIGPWWSAANLITVVFGMSLAVGLLSNTRTLSEAPRIALVLALWTLISSNLVEAVDLFEGEKGLLLNMEIAEVSLIARMVWRNTLIFAHNIAVIILVFLIAGQDLNTRLLILLPIAFVISAGTLFPAYAFARSIFFLRDLKTILPSVIQLVFFLTPILWIPPSSGPMAVIFAINPAGWVIEFARLFILENIFDSYLLVKMLMFTFASLLLISLSAKSMYSIRKLL